MKKIALLLALVMVMSFAFAGCVTEPSADAPASDVQTSGDATGEKVAVYSMTSDPGSMDSSITDSTPTINTLRHTTEGLVVLDKEDNAVPAIAESWDISEDGKTYTFHLRKDAVWNNGEPVTANDFYFAWTLLFTQSSAAPFATTWGSMIDGALELLNIDDTTDKEAYDEALANIGYKVVDDYTFEVTLTNPYPYFLTASVFPNWHPINEKFYNEVGGMGSYGTEADKICTNGMFNIESWEHESEIVMVKNPNYYGEETNNIDKLIFKIIPDSTTAYNGFVAGEVDVLNVTFDQSVMADGAGYRTESYNDGSSWYFAFQTNQLGTNNVNIRKALTYAVDAESFVKNVIKNNSKASYGLTATTINNGEYAKALGGNLMDRESYAADNYAKAKELLQKGCDELGMTADELDLYIICDDTDIANKYSAFFQEQWKTNLDLDVRVESMTYQSRLQHMAERDFSIILAGWSADYNDAIAFLELWATGNGNNEVDYSSEEYDSLVLGAVSEKDPAVRTQMLVDAEKLLMEDMPVGPVYNRTIDYAVSDHIDDVVCSSFDNINFRWTQVK